jgi:hypothetical protein
MCVGVRRKEGTQCIRQSYEEGVRYELLFGFGGSRLRSNDTWRHFVEGAVTSLIA